MRVYLPQKPLLIKITDVSGNPLPGTITEWNELSHTCLLKFENLPDGCTSGDINLPDDIPDFALIKDRSYMKNWVVYCQKPFSCPASIIQYLGNYTHRVAISNHRIQAFKDGKVTFGYKDYKSGALQRSITLEADEFIRRFMQHILPCGF